MGIEDQAVAVVGRDIHHTAVDHVARHGGAVEVDTLGVGFIARTWDFNQGDIARVDDAAAHVAGAHFKAFSPDRVAQVDIAGLNDIAGDVAAGGGEHLIQRPIDDQATYGFAAGIQGQVGVVAQRALDIGQGNIHAIGTGLGRDDIARAHQGHRLIERLGGPYVLPCADVKLHRADLCGNGADHHGQQGFLELLALHLKLHLLRQHRQCARRL